MTERAKCNSPAKHSEPAYVTQLQKNCTSRQKYITCSDYFACALQEQLVEIGTV